MIKLNGVSISPTLFPDRTSQVWQIEKGLLTHTREPDKLAKIEWDFTQEGEFMQLAQLMDLIRPYFGRFHLYMPFLPYARQDKPISNNETFALCTFATLLNSLKFDKVEAMDIHNFDRASEYIDNLEDIFPKGQIEQAFLKSDSTLICYPDDGARVRYANKFPYRYSILGHKVRDSKTGYITDYQIEVPEGVQIKGANILIIDDICDGGMTFKILAEQLRSREARRITLYTTHGIYSKGLKTLVNSGITQFFTFRGEAHELHDGSIAYQR